MNKNAPMVQEYVLGAAAPHFYYPPDTYLIEEIWSDTDDEEEHFLNNSFRDVLVSAEIASQLMPEEGRISKARVHDRLQDQRARLEEDRKRRQQVPGGITYAPGVSRGSITGVPGGGRANMLPNAPKPGTGPSSVAPPQAPMSWAAGRATYQQARQSGFSATDASELGDEAYYRAKTLEDRVGRNRAGRAVIHTGLLGLAGMAPHYLPSDKVTPMTRVALLAGAVGASALAESGLPEGAIRQYVVGKMKKHREGIAATTDRTMRRYGGVAHTPERDLLELSARRTGTGSQAESVRNQRKNLARQHALSALDVKPDVRALYAAMDSTPPSKGYITSAKTGRVLAHATGNTADYFPPFTMKQMAGRVKERDAQGNYKTRSAIKGGLRGNDYTRSRSVGGMTAEDVRTGLVFGARKAEVISPDGAEWIKFTERAQSPKSLVPGLNTHIHRITRDYAAVKSNINANPALKDQFKTGNDRHNAAVSYLAWKYPKYVVGPQSTKAAPMRGTKPEQTPYTDPKSVKSSATYGQLRGKIKQSLNDTVLPETMGKYPTPIPGVQEGRTTLRQKAAANRVVKPGIDQARKMGAKGAVTALRIGTAKDKAQAKRIVKQSGLWNEHGRYIPARSRGAVRAAAQKAAAEKGNVNAQTQALRQAGWTQNQIQAARDSGQISGKREVDWQKSQAEAIQSIADKIAKSPGGIEGTTAETVANRVHQSAAGKFVGHKMTDFESEQIKQAGRELHARLLAGVQEKRTASGKTNKMFGKEEREIEGFAAEAIGDAGSKSDSEVIASAAARVIQSAGGSGLVKATATDAKKLISQLTISIAGEDTDDVIGNEARNHLARKLSRGDEDQEKVYRKLLNPDDFEDEAPF